MVAEPAAQIARHLAQPALLHEAGLAGAGMDPWSPDLFHHLGMTLDDIATDRAVITKKGLQIVHGEVSVTDEAGARLAKGTCIYMPMLVTDKIKAAQSRAA